MVLTNEYVYASPIPHTIYGREGCEMCLLTKDPQSEFKAYVEQRPVRGLKQVLSVTTLRKEYGLYKDKRKLMSAFDLFLADDRILPLLPPLLGKGFFARKK